MPGARQACSDLRPEAVIAVEGHGLESVVADAHGSVRARVSVSGPGGHGWADRGRPSAIHELLRIGTQTVAGGYAESPVNVGLISGGISVNAIAPSAQFTVEKRATDPSELVEFHALLEGLASSPPLELSVEILGERPAGPMPRDHPLLHDGHWHSRIAGPPWGARIGLDRRERGNRSRHSGDRFGSITRARYALDQRGNPGQFARTRRTSARARPRCDAG